MGKNKFIFIVLFKRKLQVLEKLIYNNNGITGPKEQVRRQLSHEKTVKDPFQPSRFEITARYARYQWG